MKPCWSYGAEDEPCDPVCGCAKCVDPEDYERWKTENPEEYERWLEDNEV